MPEPGVDRDGPTAADGNGDGITVPILSRRGKPGVSILLGSSADGLGPQRIAMLRYHIQDIRLFWQNYLRFLEQF